MNGPTSDHATQLGEPETGHPNTATFVSRAVVPRHQKAPEGTTQSVHDINLVLTAILIGAEAEFQWLNRENPDVQAAKRCAKRMAAQVAELEALVKQLDQGNF